jgi:hypothetical protein
LNFKSIGFFFKFILDTFTVLSFITLPYHPVSLINSPCYIIFSDTNLAK